MLPYATIEQTKKGFEAVGERMTSIENQTALGYQELKEAYEALQKQLRVITRAYMTGRTETGEQYNRFWPTEEQAKDFGELILKALRRKALGETVMTEGGVLVPEELAARMIDKLGQYGVFRRNAMVVPLGSDRQIVPKVEADLTVYAPGEGGTITESDTEFSQVGLTMHKLCCLCKASTELAEDSVIALGEIIATSMTRSIAKKEDQIGFCGDGTSTYFGMTGAVGALRGVDATIGNIKGLKVGTGNAYSELTLEDFEGVVAILPDDADAGAKWYVNRKFFFNVMYRLARAAGAADLFAILTPTKTRYFMGFPVEFVSAMPSVEANSQICALLADLQLGAFLGERRQLQMEQSTDVYFANDQIGFRGRERIDINAYGVGDISEAGAIVGLITAAS
jgi:HK97 family phage major capsid protein